MEQVTWPALVRYETGIAVVSRYSIDGDRDDGWPGCEIQENWSEVGGCSGRQLLLNVVST